jgi:hypothetical protein
VTAPTNTTTPATYTATPTGARPDAKRAVARGYDGQYHGTAEFRGGNCPQSTYYERGRFGRMFAGLPRYAPDPLQLMRLGAVGGPMDAQDVGPGANPRNPDHPGGLDAGYTFLGQFVDHDITFDPTSSLERQVDPEAVANFRTPSLELDSVYGAGPGASPHLYQRADRDRLLVGRDLDGGATDLPRNPEGTALLGDPRNDENLIVSQLHVAFLKFHNAVVDYVGTAVPAGRSRFEEAQRLVRWHYQHLVVHEFLPRICGEELVRDVLENGRVLYRWRNEPYIPVEFAVAAYRFGHSQVRPGYAISGAFARPLFPVPPAPGAPAPGTPAPGATPPAAAPDPRPGQPPLPSSLVGGRQIRAEQAVEWRRFFDLGAAGAAAGAAPGELQTSKRFDARLSTPLLHLPFAAGTPEDPASLAQRNLMRGVTFGLPSGQAVARAMSAQLGRGRARRVDVLGRDELAELREFGLDEATPLWYYVLREADLREGGRTLGRVGGRIVAEVLIGLLEGDPLSYLNADRDWRPLLGADPGRFTPADLLRVAGAA